MKQAIPTCPAVAVHEVEMAALLKTQGFELADARVEGRRVVFLFAESQPGEVQAVVRASSVKGLQVNSLDLFDALRWARDRVFSLRRAAGLDGRF